MFISEEGVFEEGVRRKEEGEMYIREENSEEGVRRKEEGEMTKREEI